MGAGAVLITQSITASPRARWTNFLTPAVTVGVETVSSGTSRPFFKAIVCGYRTAPSTDALPTENGGFVMFGPIASDGTNMTMFTILPGQQLLVEAPIGQKLDLTNYAFAGANGSDKLFIAYV